MRLQIFHRDVKADEHPLQFPSYLFNVGEGKLLVELKETIPLP